MTIRDDLLTFGTELYESLSLYRIECERLQREVVSAIASVDAASFAVAHGHAKVSELLLAIDRMESIYRGWMDERTAVKEVETQYNQVAAELAMMDATDERNDQ